MSKKKIKAKFPAYPFLLIPVILLFFLSLHLPSPKRLNIPREKEVFLPPPLQFTNIYFNVLGMQKIEPEDIINYVNLERQKRGILELRTADKLTEAASMRSKVILKYQNFSHQDPYEGIELTTVLPKVNYHFIYASENIGMGGVSAEDFVAGFMNSTSHRENLLNTKLIESGAAVASGRYREYYVNIAVQLFGIPSGKDEFYGYNESDKKYYRISLNRLNYQLNPVIFTFSNIFGKKNSDLMKLKRQKEILQILNKKIEEENPFYDDEIPLIKEYNSYL